MHIGISVSLFDFFVITIHRARAVSMKHHCDSFVLMYVLSSATIELSDC